MTNGIDYSCTQSAFAEIQAENSHLFKFAQETGLTYSLNSYLSAAEIWEKLEQWYLDNGTLVYEETSNGKRKAVWADQPKIGDRNVKAVNQVLARFKQLFPKTKLGVAPHPNGKKTFPVLQGITFDLSKSILNKEECTAIRIFPTPNSTPNSTPTILINQASTPTTPNFSNSSEREKKSETLNTEPDNLIPKDTKEMNKLGVVDGDACPTRIVGVELGVELGVEETLIAMRSPLLRIEPPNDVVSLLELKVQGIIENIRELILSKADWGQYQQYFAPIDENLKKEVFKYLSANELEILKTLQPIDDEQRKAKEILDMIRSAQDLDVSNQSNDLDLKFNEAIATGGGAAPPPL